jgi:hypothetical protein
VRQHGLKTVIDYASRRPAPVTIPARWRGHFRPSVAQAHEVPRGPASPSAGSPRCRHGRPVGRNGVAAALGFTILTAARALAGTRNDTGEVDLENRIWTIPSERMREAGQRAPGPPLAIRSASTHVATTRRSCSKRDAAGKHFRYECDRRSAPHGP